MRPSTLIITGLISLAMMSAMITVYAFYVAQYHLTPSSSGFNYQTYNRFNETKNLVDQISNNFDTKATVNTFGIIPTFINSAFTLVKLIGAQITTFTTLISQYTTTIGIDPIWAALAIALLIFGFIIGVIAVMQGRA